MHGALPNVAYLEGGAVGNFTLDGQVVLIGNRWLDRAGPSIHRGPDEWISRPLQLQRRQMPSR